MDNEYENLLKNVKNIEQYSSVTQEIRKKCKNMKVNIKMATAMAITKLKSFEIEYFSKSHQNGAACILFERLLRLPPSKTWGLLNTELISSLHYWLQAIRMQLTNGEPWWRFLKLILKFIQEINAKDPSMPDKLVELTADSLLGMATTDALSAQQCHEILHCLNIYCTDSSREVRIALQNKFNGFFNQLAWRLSTCGYQPLQYSSLETLVRWLVPRGEPTLRAAAAARWFPPATCPDHVREIFLNTKWMSFTQDARNFLNAFNDANGLVTSVVCKRLFVGEMLIISGAESQQTWLDINTGNRSVSTLIDRRALQRGATYSRIYETLVIDDGSTRAARLHSETRELTLSVDMHRPPCIFPSGVPVGEGSDVTVTIIISSATDVGRLDPALRTVFRDKYQMLVSSDAVLTLSPARETRKKQNSSSEESRFSQPVEVKCRRLAGPGVAYRNFKSRLHAESLASPSSVSTSSLAQLHDRLAALPRHRFQHDRVSRSILNPGTQRSPLSTLTEYSETDLHSFQSKSTINLSPLKLGVVSYSQSKKKAESDTELLKQKTDANTRSFVSDELSVSCLLASTVGTDESVINDTIERISKREDFRTTNIVDLLAQEAIRAEFVKNKLKETDVNSDESQNGENSEAIENTPIENARDLMKKSRVGVKRPCIVNKSSTDDESNTEAIVETSVFVNPRNSKIKQSVLKAYEQKEAEHRYDAQRVEEFFTQHIVETVPGQIAISPTLARKINASTSHTSESFDENCLIVNYELNVDLERFEINDIEVIECLNDMVDKVGRVNIHTQENEVNDQLSKRKETLMTKRQINTPKREIEPTSDANKKKKLKPLANKTENQENKVNEELTNKQATKTKRQKNTPNKKKKPKPVANKTKKQATKKKPPHKMSTILEWNDEEIIEVVSPKHNVESARVAKINPIINQNDTESPAADSVILKRKRKLYSPKDDEMHREKPPEPDSDDIILSELKYDDSSETPIRRERKRHIWRSRSRKARDNFELTLSPTTLQNDAIFDKLKSTVENNEKLVLVDSKSAVDVYNFSGSEDSDFETKKPPLRKRLTKNIESFESAKPVKRRARCNYSEKYLNDEATKTKQVKKRTAFKRGHIKNKTDLIEPAFELDDEKIREARLEELNCSIVTRKPNVKVPPANLDLVLAEPPQMELIIDDQESVPKKETKKNKLAIRTNDKSAILNKNKSSNTTANNDSGTSSPLPGLIVETVSKRKNDTDELTFAAIEFQKISEEGIDETYDTHNMSHNVPVIDEISVSEKNRTTLKVPKEVPKKRKLKNSDTKPKHKSIKKIKNENINQNITTEDEVIEIYETLDVQSDISIASDNIRAHANSDDIPPSPESLDKSITPRETVDMDDNSKKIYMTLNRQLYDTTSEMQSKSLKEHDIRLENDNNSRVSSISSHIQVHTFDTRRMVPSRRTSDTSSSNSDINRLETQETSKEKTKQIRKVMTLSKPKLGSPKHKVPIVSIVPLSSEEIDRWSMPRSLNSGRSETQNSEKARNSSPMFVYNTRKATKNAPISDNESTSSEDEKDNDSSVLKTKRFTRSFCKNIFFERKINNSVSDNNIPSGKVRSTISPVNIDFALQRESNQSSPISRRILNEKPKALRKDAMVPHILSSPDTSVEIPMPQKSSTGSMDKPSKAAKRCSSPTLNVGKAMRNESTINLNMSQSGPSVSSVNDWFRRNDISKDDNALAPIEDVLKAFIEKVDTSLVDPSTNKTLAELYMEVENIAAILQKQQDLYKSQFDTYKAQMDTYKADQERFGKMCTQVLDQLRKKVLGAIRLNRNQRRLVVSILKEDVQAALDHLAARSKR